MAINRRHTQALSDPRMRPTRAWWVLEEPSTSSHFTQGLPQQPGLHLWVTALALSVLQHHCPNCPPPPPPSPRSLAGQRWATQEPNGFVEDGRRQMFLGSVPWVCCQSRGAALDTSPSTALHSLPSAARDNRGLQPGLAQKGTREWLLRPWSRWSPSLA